MERHSGAAFNHSCLKVPVNPSNQLPFTSYERKQVPLVMEVSPTNFERIQKSAHFQGVNKAKSTSTANLNKEVDLEPSPDIKSPAGRSSENIHTNESYETFLNFYESIPDYSDVQHMPDKEFHIKLQDLKERQKLLTNNLHVVDSFNFSTKPEKAVETIDSTSQKTYIKDTNTKARQNKTSLTAKIKPYRPRSSPSNSLNVPTSSPNPQLKTFGELKSLHNLFLPDTQHNPYKDKENNKRNEDTPSTMSVSSMITLPMNKNRPMKVLDRSGTRLSDSDDLSDPKANVNDMTFKEKSRILSPHLEKQKTHGQKREAYFPATSLTQSPYSIKNSDSNNGDDSNSVLDTMWSRFNICDTARQPEMFSDLESLLEEQYLTHSVPDSPINVFSKGVAWKEPNSTVPIPFSMTLRDEEEAHLNQIRHKVFSTLVKTNRSVDDAGKQTSKANPVPLKTRLPLFDKIMSDQEKRRRKGKKQCISELRSQMQPFSFMVRDKERRRHRLCCSTPELRDVKNKSKTFKARPVPKNLFGSLVYQRMREDEFYRALKKKIRAEELLKASSLPPSMAAREHLSQIIPTQEKIFDEDSLDFPKMRSRMIPNYKTSHNHMKQELGERIRENITTSPQPFRLRTGELRRRTKRSSASSSPYKCFSSTISQERPRPRSALCLSGNRNNLAAVLRIQSARKRLEQEMNEKKDAMKKQEEARLKCSTTRRHPIWQTLNYSTREDLEIRMQTRREEERLRREQYEHDMELMLDRVERIPPLFLRQSQVQRNQKKKIVKKSNIKSQKSLAYSSPDLFSEFHDSNMRDESDDKRIKVPPKVVSINETVHTFNSPPQNSLESSRPVPEGNVHVYNNANTITSHQDTITYNHPDSESKTSEQFKYRKDAINPSNEKVARQAKSFQDENLKENKDKTENTTENGGKNNEGQEEADSDDDDDEDNSSSSEDVSSKLGSHSENDSDSDSGDVEC